MELDNPAAQFNVQSVRVDSKLDYIGTLRLVRQLPNATRITHVTPRHSSYRRNKTVYDFRANSGNLAMFAAILRASSFVNNFAADRRPYGRTVFLA